MLSFDQVMRACERKVEDDVSSQASQHIVQTENFIGANILFGKAIGNSIHEALYHRRIPIHFLQGKERG